MSINRKTFLKSSALLMGGVILGSNKGLAKLLQENNGFKSLRDNLGIFIGGGGTIGWFADNDAVVVIDTQNPDSAKEFMNKFREKTSRKIDYLFNSHHHGDHTSGNIYLKDFSNKIVAHENCPILQKKAYGGGERANSQVYAETTFKDTWSTDAGKEKITASYFGPAHTGGDIIIHFENADVAHVGDLVFNRTYPFIDQNGGGSIKGWIEVLDNAGAAYSINTTFICGHANADENVVFKNPDIIGMRNYLSSLLEFVSKEKKAGKSLEEIKKAEGVPGFTHLKERWKGALAANLEAAYNEINIK